MMSQDLILRHLRLQQLLLLRITDPQRSDLPDPPEWHLMPITPVTTTTISRPLQDLSTDLQVRKLIERLHSLNNNKTGEIFSFSTKNVNKIVFTTDSVRTAYMFLCKK